MKRYRFKSAEARHKFAAVSDTNKTIANSVCDRVFYAAMPRDAIDEIFFEINGITLFPEYFPVFFGIEVREYLEEVSAEDVAHEISQKILENNDVEQLLAENATLRERMSKLENRLERLERLV